MEIQIKSGSAESTTLVADKFIVVVSSCNVALPVGFEVVITPYSLTKHGVSVHMLGELLMLKSVLVSVRSAGCIHHQIPRRGWVRIYQCLTNDDRLFMLGFGHVLVCLVYTCPYRMYPSLVRLQWFARSALQMQTTTITRWLIYY